MTPREKIGLAIGAAVLTLLLWMFHSSSVEAEADKAKMEAMLKQQGDVIATLQKSIDQRDAEAKAKNAAIDRQVASAATPAQIASLIQQYVGMQKPITVNIPTPAPSADGKPSPALPDAPSTLLLNQDQAKQLLDFTASCKKCQNDLAKAEGDSADKDKQITAVKAERDAAVIVAKGGTKWQRVKRAGKWVLVGIAIGFAIHHK